MKHKWEKGSRLCTLCGTEKRRNEGDGSTHWVLPDGTSVDLRKGEKVPECPGKFGPYLADLSRLAKRAFGPSVNPYVRLPLENNWYRRVYCITLFNSARDAGPVSFGTLEGFYCQLRPLLLRLAKQRQEAAALTGKRSGN